MYWNSFPRPGCCDHGSVSRTINNNCEKLTIFQENVAAVSGAEILYAPQKMII